MSPAADYPPIEELALVGNGRTAALISLRGNVEWFCAPRFDSAALLCALLDREQGGRFRIGPRAEATRVERRYVGHTAVLETTFTTPRGKLRLTDAMPAVAEDERRRRPWPEHQILRKVECLEGEVDVELAFEPRADYGRKVMTAEDRGRLGVWCQTDAESLILISDLPLETRHGGAHACASLQAGSVRWTSFTYTHGEPAVILPLGETAEELLHLTLGWWERWARRCRYRGPYEDAVIRSAQTLALLDYAPSGAVIAAATTSLPEVLGKDRNWDYRYCWLRDASWALQALFDLGYEEHAQAFLDWVLYTTRTGFPRLQTLYDVHGATRVTERFLHHLAGYRGSRPVRAGNAAHGQLQLDVYGEVIHAAFQFIERGGRFDGEDVRFLVGLGETVAASWRSPDEGIWELRGGPRHNTYSKVMCWAALDCLLALHERHGVAMPAERFRTERAAIRAAIETRAYDESIGCYYGDFDRQLLDAAVLRMPAAGYLDAADARMRSTYRHIVDRLGAPGGLLFRYENDFDEQSAGEGAFLLCSFWAVEVQARAGEVEEAEKRFAQLLECANDVGLFAEQVDPQSGTLRGNFPQAFTHIGLINAALTLQACRGDRKLRARPWTRDAASA